MTKLFHLLLALIASASDSQLRRHVRYLKEENQILRARIPGQVHTRLEERQRLLKFGLPLGPGITEGISIVPPGTFYRWRREAKRSKPAIRKSHGKSQALRELVLKIARETGFGYTKILGELRSPGISRICRQSVKNILKEENVEPSLKRSRGTWDDCLKAYAETLWACAPRTEPSSEFETFETLPECRKSIRFQASRSRLTIQSGSRRQSRIA